MNLVRIRLQVVQLFRWTLLGQEMLLCRRELAGNGMTATTCLAEGIEDLRVQFGIDTDDDGIPDLYAPNPTVAQMENVVVVRLYVLARSRDTDPAYTDTKTYNLGDVTIGPLNDGYYRSVFTSTVALRNTANLALLE